MQDLESLRLIASLLESLGGKGEGRRLLARLLEDREPPELLARDIARSPAAARLRGGRKPAAGEEGDGAGLTPIGPDARALGLPPARAGERFAERFTRDIAPRLGKRRAGYEAILAAIADRPAPLIIETGCLRKAGNWEGDGQSSAIFDLLATDRGGRFFSIDLSLASVEAARRVCGPATTILLNDSVAALEELASLGGRPVDLLYLDSFDLDPANPMPSAIHHAQELIAARPMLRAGSVVCVDDYRVRGEVGGKGAIVDRYMHAARARVLHEGYQKAWVMI